MKITHRLFARAAIMLFWPLVALGGPGGQTWNSIFGHGDSPAMRDYQQQLKAAFDTFPLLQPKVDDQGQPAFQSFPLRNPLIIGNTNTYGFRIQVPQRKNQEDFVWAFVQPGVNFCWDMTPAQGDFPGFADYHPQPIADYNNMEGLRPINPKTLILQTMDGDQLKDGQTYLVWFAFGPKHSNFISVKFTFASLGPRKIHDVGVLEKTLALSLKNPPQPGPPKPDDPVGSGTGFFVTNDGYLVTCFHVVKGADHVRVKIGDKMADATVVKTDPVNDLALLKVAGSTSALAIRPSGEIMLGDSVFTIGFPDIELQGVTPKLTKGEISALAGIRDDPRTFQISVAVQPGNSGGPLVDTNGNVVGVIVAKLSSMAVFEATGMLPEDVNYATKSAALKDLLASVSEISAKLKKPVLVSSDSFADSVKRVEDSVALVLVY